MMRQQGRSLLLFLLVGLGFWAAYMAIGLQLSAHRTFHNDVFFHSDLHRVLVDMTLFDARHKRTNVHPLFVLFTNPFGIVLSLLIGSPASAAVILNSLIGGACIGGAGVFLSALVIPVLRALLLSLILGCSTAHLFFGSAPETYSLSALIMITFFYLVHQRSRELRYLVPAGVFSFGVLITNLAIVVIGYAGSLLALSRSNIVKMRQIFLFAMAVVSISIVLAGVQKLIWRQSALFFVPNTYTGESNFVKIPTRSREFGQREARLFRYILAFDWFAPATLTTPDSKREVRFRFENRNLRDIPIYGRVALTLWAALLVAAAFAFVRYRMFEEGLPLGLFVSVLFNYGLHSIYGDDFFLYSCNTSFLLIALIGISTARLPISRKFARVFNGGLGLLLAFEAANNTRFVLALLEVRHS